MFQRNSCKMCPQPSDSQKPATTQRAKADVYRAVCEVSIRYKNHVVLVAIVQALHNTFVWSRVFKPTV